MEGRHQHTIDSKGRLFIPAKLREELGEAFYIAQWMDGCLGLFSQEAWNDMRSRILTGDIRRKRYMERKLFANSERFVIDAQGRVVIPAGMRAYAGLKKDVYIIGVGERAEIWDVETYHRLDEELSQEEFNAALEEVGY